MEGRVPSRLTSLIGRGPELEAIAAEIGRNRLLTLTGPGGVGKTTLALEVSQRAAADFADGVHWVDLAPLAGPGAVEGALSLTLGIEVVPGASPVAMIASVIGDGRRLIVLDNCEHLLDQCAALAEQLLADAPNSTLLATSRAPLGARGEVDWRVPPLSLPGAGDTGDSDAIRLFAERATAVNRDFALDGDNEQAVGEICVHLDGMPLGIELAAGRMRALSPRQVADGLDRALTLIAGGARTALPRQQTLRASIEWSYGLLEDRHRLLLERLSVFRGGFTLELAEAVCADERLPPESIVDVVEDLVERSLVVAAPPGSGRRRYRLLEVVRQFAAEQLESAGVTGELADRHRDALRELAERHWILLLTGQAAEAMPLLEDEGPNLFAAIEHGIASDPVAAQRIAQTATVWMMQRGRLGEGRDALERALEAAGDTDRAQRAKSLGSLANICAYMGDFDLAHRLATEGLEIAEEVETDPEAIGICLLATANSVTYYDPTAAAEPIDRLLAFGEATGLAILPARAAMLRKCADWFTCAPGYLELREEDMARIRAGGDPEVEALALSVQAGCHLLDLNETECRRYAGLAGEIAARAGAASAVLGAKVVLCNLEVMLEPDETTVGNLSTFCDELRNHGAVFILARAELIRGEAMAANGDLDASASHLARVLAREFGGVVVELDHAALTAMEVERLRGNRSRAAEIAEATLGHFPEALGQVYARLTLARFAVADGNRAEAERLIHEALELVLERSQWIHLPATLEALAQTVAALGASEEAARLLGAAQNMRQTRGPRAWPAQRSELDELAAELAEVQGEKAFGQARAEGAELSQDELIGWIRRSRGERKRPPGGWESLTPTELEVVRHLADGLTNPQIGERMFITRATVKTHLAHVFQKLGVSSRVEVARMAAGRSEAGRPRA